MFCLLARVAGAAIMRKAVIRRNAGQNMQITPDEYRDRQRALAGKLAAAGFDGALIIARGGSTYDRFANVLYLTGHYQHYSFLPEFPPTFSGRAHTAFLLRADAANILCICVPEIDERRIVADRIACGEVFADTVARGLFDLGLGDARLGLIGADVMPLQLWRALSERTPGVRWQDADDLLISLRRIKSPAEQVLIRDAAATNRRAVSAFLAALRPGVTESEAVAEAARVVTAEGGGIYYAATSSGPATRLWMSSPLPGYSPRRLEDGDLIRLDLGIVKHGYLSDFGRAAVVGRPRPEQIRLIGVLHGALDAAIGAARPGGTVGDIIDAGDRALARAGVAMGATARPGQIVASYPVHWGHCLGMGWERPYLVEAEATQPVEPGMYLAIERALTLDGVGTVAAEQNLLVGESGAELLTAGPDGRWS